MPQRGGGLLTFVMMKVKNPYLVNCPGVQEGEGVGISIDKCIKKKVLHCKICS